MSKTWDYCPECGSEEIQHEEGEHKQCASCNQEWFSDIDYSNVVRHHLAGKFHDKDAVIDWLKVKLAERDALLADIAKRHWSGVDFDLPADLATRIKALSASAEPSAPKCSTCNDQGEVYSGKMADQGYNQPPEPVMDACPDCKWSAAVERDEVALIEALRTCEKWFIKHSPTAPLIGGLGDAEHPMLTHIRAALGCKP